MAMLKEFKEFAMRGSVVDLAVGLVIGTAFGAIVKSLVDDVLMPPIGMVVGNVDFSELKAPFGISYGKFLNTVINFLIVAFAIFMVVKIMNRLKREEPKPPAAVPPQEKLLTEIRDLLKARSV